MIHPNPSQTPDVSDSSVRSPNMVGSCPICGRPLPANQTACSPKCRAARSRQRQEAKREERDAKMRLLLTEALGLLSDVNAPHGTAKETGSSPDH